jgi:hypothetical protein
MLAMSSDDVLTLPFEFKLKTKKNDVVGDGNCFLYCIFDFLKMLIDTDRNTYERFVFFVLRGETDIKWPLNSDPKEAKKQGVEMLRDKLVFVSEHWEYAKQILETGIAADKTEIENKKSREGLAYISHQRGAVERVMYKAMNPP